MSNELNNGRLSNGRQHNATLDSRIEENQLFNCALLQHHSASTPAPKSHAHDHAAEIDHHLHHKGA